jgi:hypothetical protein
MRQVSSMLGLGIYFPGEGALSANGANVTAP